MNSSDAEVVRDALRTISRDQSSAIGQPPEAKDILYLPSHASALDPNVSLVIGNRGMGKTFWANALVNGTTRAELSRRKSVSRVIESLEGYAVTFAFADRQGVIGVSSNHVKAHSHVDPEDYWRAVIIERIGECFKIPNLHSFSDLIGDAENSLAILAGLDRHISSAGTPILLLFDQLDQLADNWSDIQVTTRGILRLALSCKSYRSIRIKIFMRPDQAADDKLFRFSDSSKLLGPAAHLRWFAPDLFALLFKHLWNDGAARSVMEANFPGLLGERIVEGIPGRLLSNTELQRTCFEAISGEAMGNSTKRGKPYTWLITHLADGKQQISPRSFLTAIRVSAERPDVKEGLAIDYHGIQAGVAEASNIRHQELEEDYPWIEDALRPLRGLTVPAPQDEFYSVWESHKIPEGILEKFHDSRAPLEIARSEEEFLSRALERSLVQLGVFEDRNDGRVNVPDIFRISAGLKRKGGVPPQRRKNY